MPTTKSLQELIIAVHFDAQIPLTVVDLADWVTYFSYDFPIIQQLPALSQVNLPTVLGPQSLQLQMLSVDSLPLPRMLLRSPDARYSILFAKDMRRYFAEQNTIKRDEIAARQLHVLNDYRWPGTKKLRLQDVKKMFVEMREHPGGER